MKVQKTQLRSGIIDNEGEKMNKEDIVNEIETIMNDAQNKIIELMKKEKILYFPYETIDQLKDMRQRHDWITESHERFFKHFAFDFKRDKDYLLCSAKTCLTENRLACSILTPEDKEKFITDFDNNAQERLDKQKRANKLYKQIEAAKEKLNNMKYEYRKLVGNDGYEV